MSYTSFPIRHAAKSSQACDPEPSNRLTYQGSASRGTDPPLHRFTADRSESDPSKNTGRPSNKGKRTKSGCYTCRIRRKKCDENLDNHGQCQTCVRLHLECLGFGNRRPHWLRNNKNVNGIRKKIKDFLGSQGLIKGTFLPHDEPPPREFLWLSEEGYHNSHNPDAPAEDEGPTTTQPYSPSLHHPSNSMATTTEPIDTWEGCDDLALPFPHQMLPEGYRPRDGTTQYPVDPMPGLKQEEHISLNSLGFKPDSDSQYSLPSGSASVHSVDDDNRFLNASMEPGFGNQRYCYSHQRFTNNTSDNDQMMLSGYSVFH